MPYCPNCHGEYLEGVTRCTDCDVPLVESIPIRNPEDSAQTDVELVELATFPHSSEAEMIQELLEENGIKTVLRGDVDPIGVASGATPSTLLVERVDLAQALELYEGYFAGKLGEEPVEGSDASEDPDQ